MCFDLVSMTQHVYDIFVAVAHVLLLMSRTGTLLGLKKEGTSTMVRKQLRYTGCYIIA